MVIIPDPDDHIGPQARERLERFSRAGRRDKSRERATRPITDTDRIERWGRVIGRALGFIFVVGLVLNLTTHWFP